MKSTARTLIAAATLLAAGVSWMPAMACDDTLVMLLTAQNPASEFSKTIRSFTNTLTVLGSALKEQKKASYDSEMKQVMDSWLEFSKRYMTSPPEEARNDRQWAEKTSNTARDIGEIGRLVGESRFFEAHNKVLELSGRIGAFFEAFGVSDEKQIFIKTSGNLTNLERLVLASDYVGAASLTVELETNLKEFVPLLNGSFVAETAAAAKQIGEISRGIAGRTSPEQLDVIIQELKSSFEALRSHILMREWFPALNQQKQEN